MALDSIQLIQSLSNANGCCGFEDEVAELGRQAAAPFCSRVQEDHLRNLYLHRAQNNGRRPVVMLDAHSDEVGFLVQAIHENGTIQFLPLGGWAASTLSAQKVRVRNADGVYLPGIVAAMPVHFMTPAQRQAGVTDISSLVIDVGATSRQEAVEVYHIRIGEPIVPDVAFSYDPHSQVMLGKALDNRLGCACVVETLAALSGEELAVDVVGTFTSQEEIGERGAFVARETVRPQVAICFEGCPADDTFAPDYLIQTAMKKGPMLRHFDCSMITNPRFQRFALDLAAQKGIPVQESVRSGGGTNGGPIHLSGQGVPVIVIGVPVRYIHSHHGFAALPDYQHAVQLAAEVVRALNEGIIEGF